MPSRSPKRRTASFQKPKPTYTIRLDIEEGEEKARLIRKAEGRQDIQLSDLVVTHVIGQGNFGKVYLGTLPQTGEKFAIKSIRKDKLAKNRNTIKAIHIEQQVLFESNHPFLCSMDYCFQTQARFYYVMPFIAGGDLQRVRKHRGRFTEEEVKFFMA